MESVNSNNSDEGAGEIGKKPCSAIPGISNSQLSSKIILNRNIYIDNIKCERTGDIEVVRRQRSRERRQCGWRKRSGKVAGAARAVRLASYLFVKV